MSDNAKAGLIFTGERFVPGKSGARLAYEHYHRYFFARHLVRGKVVLDLGCGEGYGACLLAEVADHVTGVELSPEAIEHAHSRYPKPNLVFQQGDCRDTRLPEHQFDVIVCFEMIEHIAEQEKLLAEVRRLLKPGGVFIVSSPEKETYSEARGYENPFHVKELYAAEFLFLLERNFSHIALFAQKICTGSVLQQIPRSDASKPTRVELTEVEAKPDKTFDSTSGLPKAAKYLLAVCSDAAIDPVVQSLSVSVWSDASETILHEPEEYNQHLQANVNQLSSQVDHLQNKTRDQDSQIHQRDKELQEKISQISQLNQSVLIKENLVREKEARIEAQDRYIEGLQQTSQVLREFEEKVKHSLAWKIYYLFLRPIRLLFRRRGNMAR